MPDRLLARFRDLFAGTKYEHRKSNLGDLVAMEFYEDLVDLGRSSLLIPRVDASDWVINTGNRRVGVSARRGDGTFGELVPGTQAIRDPGFRVARGSVATVEIGVEVKILNKAHDARRFALSVEDLPGALVSVVGQESEDGLDVPADSLRSLLDDPAIPPSVRSELAGEFRRVESMLARVRKQQGTPKTR